MDSAKCELHGDKLDRILTKVGKLEDAIIGDLDKPGLGERVRLLESEEAKRKWTIRAIMAAVLTALVNSFWR